MKMKIVAIALALGRCVAHDSCWHRPGNEWKDCEWVGHYTETRCSARGHDGRFANEVCAECWFQSGDPEKGCDWVADMPLIRCEIQNDAGVKAKEFCPVCGVTTGCVDAYDESDEIETAAPTELETAPPTSRPSLRPPTYVPTIQPSTNRPSLVPSWAPSVSPTAGRPEFELTLEVREDFANTDAEQNVLTRAIVDALAKDAALVTSIDCCYVDDESGGRRRLILGNIQKGIKFFASLEDPTDVNELRDKVLSEEFRTILGYTIQEEAVAEDVPTLESADVKDVEEVGAPDGDDDDEGCRDIWMFPHESSYTCVFMSIIEGAVLLVGVYALCLMVCSIMALQKMMNNPEIGPLEAFKQAHGAFFTATNHLIGTGLNAVGIPTAASKAESKRKDDEAASIAADSAMAAETERIAAEKERNRIDDAIARLGSLEAEIGNRATADQLTSTNQRLTFLETGFFSKWFSAKPAAEVPVINLNVNGAPAPAAARPPTPPPSPSTPQLSTPPSSPSFSSPSPPSTNMDQMGSVTITHVERLWGFILGGWVEIYGFEDLENIAHYYPTRQLFFLWRDDVRKSNTGSGIIGEKFAEWDENGVMRLEDAIELFKPMLRRDASEFANKYPRWTQLAKQNT